MTHMTEKTERMPAVQFTRAIDAPRELVFAVWTQARHLKHWWGPHHFTNPRCEADLRIGGKIHIDMRGPDGTVYPMTGEFREIVPPERLVFISAPLDANGNVLFEVVTSVVLKDKGGKTEMTLDAGVVTMTPEAAQYTVGMEQGWSQSLKRLASYVAEVSGDVSNREIVLSREYDAPRELVYQAFTEPKHVVHWWGPNGFTNSINVMDVRPGGFWRFIMHGPDGTDYPNRIRYLEVVPNQRLVYLHGEDIGDAPDDFEVTLTFETVGDKTKVTLRLLFETEEQCSKVKEYGIEGGKQTLSKLADYLKTI